MSLPGMDRLMRGLHDLRTASLLSLIASIILLAILIVSLGMMGIFFEISEMPHRLGSMLAALSGLLIGIFVALVLEIIAFYKFFTATGHLKSYDPARLGIGRTGVILELAGLIIIIIGFALMLPFLSSIEAQYGAPESIIASLFAYLGVLLLGALMIVVGAVLFSVMLMRLGELEGVDKQVKWAGLFYLVGILLSLIPFISIISVVLEIVALIMLYSGCGSSLKSLSSTW